ncbi:alanine--tRNA ligase [[Clostridium] colinum]|uniref:alanine--tRNA ligase n=1 Tax=[Clostridium] colinum TaxID=36835 RepID=UPI002023CC03|nr:alanine--tRNA ligase [[Clostridium] colinum]
MKNLGVNEIRKKYLDFFQQKGHLKMNSFSLVPQNDKSLLLINSGMAPLKPYFTGQQIPPNRRVTTCQKCIRTGDIENVGKTARHGTFFEMLGNFSFGDYFKEEAIPWAWEFFTKVLELPEDKLYVSVYQDDDEAFEIWNKKVGIPANKIVRLGKEDNFWEHGTGPCGPCSEIYFDKGEQYGCDNPNCYVGCDCDRYMEIWNLVFTQFNREEDGTYTNLANPNIDTGMGLERIATVMQSVNSIFDVDTVKAIRDKVCQLANCKYGEDNKKDISIRVITDHIRSVTFMTADGVLPSNEGRGYVLRRLLRRAARHGKILGIDDLFLADLSKTVIETSKEAYQELEEKKDYIYKILTVEEERFYATIDTGMELLKQKINELKATNTKTLKGEDAFKLYDTYGFPFDLMKEILEEENMTLDEDEFLKEMEKQKNKARSAREEDTYMGAKETIFHKLDPSMKSEFLGYENNSIKDSKVLAIICEDEIVEVAKEGQKVVIVVDKTPFYAEMGGQVGDKGTIQNDNLLIEINDTTNFGGNKILHYGIVKKGEVKVNDSVVLKIDEEERLSTARNHTATHILHKALKEILGNHIEQAGSLVSKSRLRFDFTHFEALTKDEILKIEKTVNMYILKGLEVCIKETDIETAKKEGATALFGEKYGDIVRVVNVGDYSIELCGGTHIKNSAQIGSFKIISESGVAAGVRRIEAITGLSALDFYEERENIIFNICENLKANPKNVVAKSLAITEENKKLLKEIESLKAKLSFGLLDEILNQKQNINGIDVLVTKVSNMDMDTLRNLGDKIKEKLSDYAILLCSDNNDKVNFIAMCSDSAIKNNLKSGDIVKVAANICGGGGGGRPNMAQAGGKDPSKIDEAIKATLDFIKEKI